MPKILELKHLGDKIYVELNPSDVFGPGMGEKTVSLYTEDEVKALARDVARTIIDMINQEYPPLEKPNVP